MYQLNRRKADTFPVRVERLPRFQALETFEQRKRAQVRQWVPVLPESLGTHLNQVALTFLIRFDCFEVPCNFTQAFR